MVLHALEHFSQFLGCIIYSKPFGITVSQVLHNITYNPVGSVLTCRKRMFLYHLLNPFGELTEGYTRTPPLQLPDNTVPAILCCLQCLLTQYLLITVTGFKDMGHNQFHGGIICW